MARGEESGEGAAYSHEACDQVFSFPDPEEKGEMMKVYFTGISFCFRSDIPVATMLAIYEAAKAHEIHGQLKVYLHDEPRYYAITTLDYPRTFPDSVKETIPDTLRG